MSSYKYTRAGEEAFLAVDNEDGDEGGKKSRKPELTLDEAIYWFDNFEEITRDARLLSQRDRAYYDNIQWTDEEVAELKRRGQPVVTINRIANSINYLLGFEKRSRSAPTAFPRNIPMDEKGAHAATDALRYVADRGGVNRKFSDVWKDMTVEGTGGMDVCIKKTPKGKPVIGPIRIHFDRLWWDPRSRELDFSDAMYKGTVVWMDLAQAEKKWPNKKDKLLATVNQFSFDETFDDRPLDMGWAAVDGKRPRVRVCQVYWRESNDDYSPWYTAQFTWGGWLDEPAESSYKQYLDDGSVVPGCPLVFHSAYINDDNERYGVVRALISPQDEINKRRSKALHQLSTRQAIAEKGAVDDPDLTRQRLAQPDALVQVNPGYRFEIVNQTDLAMGQAQLLQEAKSEIDAIGANAALTGRQANATSGRDLQVRQQGGMIELENVFDSLRQFKICVYRQMWDRIRQFWTAETWIRVTDDPKNLKFIALNRPVTAYEEALARGIDIPAPEQLPPQVQALLAQVVRIENRAAEMDLDFILDETPDVVSLQQEEFAKITEMVSKGLPIPADIVIEASNLRNKDQILERLRGPSDPKAQAAQQQKQQQMEAMQMANIELELQQKQADIAKTTAETQKTTVEAASEMGELVQTVRAPEEALLAVSQVVKSAQ